MLKIKLTFPYNWPIIKQTPGRSGKWGECMFYINQDISECDFWVVFDGLQQVEKTVCPLDNTLLITAEPPSIKTYHKDFLNQFASVLTCHQVNHKNVIHSQQGLNWMVGGRYIKETHSWEEKHTKDYDELTSIETFKKEKLLSIILSNKTLTQGHRDRLEFLNKLKEYFKNDLDIYGVGFNEVPDKWDVIYPYKYNIVIENSSFKNYWTEKLSDAFLAGAYPIYHGCPNIFDFFSSDDLSLINIRETERAIEKIKSIIDADTYEKKVDEIKTAKSLILNRYNFFNVIDGFIKNRFNRCSTKSKVTLIPEYKFGKHHLLDKVSKALSKLY